MPHFCDPLRPALHDQTRIGSPLACSRPGSSGHSRHRSAWQSVVGPPQSPEPKLKWIQPVAPDTKPVALHHMQATAAPSCTCQLLSQLLTCSRPAPQCSRASARPGTASRRHHPPHNHSRHGPQRICPCLLQDCGHRRHVRLHRLSSLCCPGCGCLAAGRCSRCCSAGRCTAARCALSSCDRMQQAGLSSANAAVAAAVLGDALLPSAPCAPDYMQQATLMSASQHGRWPDGHNSLDGISRDALLPFDAIWIALGCQHHGDCSAKQSVCAVWHLLVWQRSGNQASEVALLHMHHAAAAACMDASYTRRVHGSRLVCGKCKRAISSVANTRLAVDWQLGNVLKAFTSVLRCIEPLCWLHMHQHSPPNDRCSVPHLQLPRSQWKSQ